MTIAGMLLRSQGFPVDDPVEMFPFIAHHIVATCEQEGIEPVGSLTVRTLTTAAVNGVPLFDDDEAGVRWELEHP